MVVWYHIDVGTPHVFHIVILLRKIGKAEALLLCFGFFLYIRFDLKPGILD